MYYIINIVKTRLGSPHWNTIQNTFRNIFHIWDLILALRANDDGCDSPRHWTHSSR